MSKKKKRTKSFTFKGLFKELFVFVIIVMFITLECYHNRSATDKNTTVITGTVSNVYVEKGLNKQSWRVFFTVAGQKCFYTANKKAFTNKEYANDLADSLKNAEQLQIPVSIWMIEHTENLVTFLSVGECKTVAAIEAESTHLTMEPYNQLAEFYRISWFFILGFVSVLFLVYLLVVHKICC